MKDSRTCATNHDRVNRQPRRGVKRYWAAVLVLLPAALLLSATSTAQDDKTPLIRTTTRLVQLNVLAVDSHNQPVRGLTQRDFRVYDNGVEQKIAHFTANTGAPPASPVQQSPLVVSNRQPSADEAPGATVILVDETILDPQLMGIVSLDLRAPMLQARMLVRDYLARVKPGQQVAVYALRRQGVVVIRDFTDDPSKLLAAANALGSPARGGFVTLNDVAASAPPRTLRPWAQNPALTDRVEGYGGAESASSGTLGYGLQAVIQHLKGVPGRKNLVWISTSFPMASTRFSFAEMSGGRDANLAGITRDGVASPDHPDPRGHFEEIRSIARSFGNANIAVYPIDAFGLTVGGSSESQHAAADMIATESGGRAIFDSNDLAGHLEEIVNQTSNAYQLGYYLNDKAWDHKYHHIELKLAHEDRGIKALCRKGYFAQDEYVDPSSDRAFIDASRSVVEAADIGVTLNVPSNPLQIGDQRVVLKLSTRDIDFEQSDNLSKAKLDVAFVQYGGDGLILNSFKDNIQLGLKQATWLKAVEQGWNYPRAISIVQGTERIRVIVRDLTTGSIGSVSVPVKSTLSSN
jgi:VWFA-related protein